MLAGRGTTPESGVPAWPSPCHSTSSHSLLHGIDTSNSALAHRYDEIPYDALPHRATHPGRMATVAALVGHVAADPDRCSVLEVGCSSGSNLIAMAVSLPAARFVGCDLSPRAIAEGRRTIEALALTNVTLVEGDLAALPSEHGVFDFIVAHGVYSWVPAHVRDGLLALADARLRGQRRSVRQLQRPARLPRSPGRLGHAAPVRGRHCRHA